MHYKDGTEAKLFDVVKFKNGNAEITGVLLSITPGTSTCNGYVQFQKPLPIMKYAADNQPELSHFYITLSTTYITLGEAELADRYKLTV